MVALCLAGGDVNEVSGSRRFVIDFRPPGPSALDINEQMRRIVQIQADIELKRQSYHDAKRQLWLAMAATTVTVLTAAVALLGKASGLMSLLASLRR